VIKWKLESSLLFIDAGLAGRFDEFPVQSISIGWWVADLPAVTNL